MREQKYGVDAVYDGRDGLDYAMSGQYDVVVLDVMLPERSGFEVVRALRAQNNAVPVLLLTARDEISDKVTGLDCGADDYMTKPVNYEELIWRWMRCCAGRDIASEHRIVVGRDSAGLRDIHRHPGGGGYGAAQKGVRAAL